MSFALTQQDAASLDAAIAAIYPRPLGGGELKQFARLFNNQSLVNELRNVLQPQLRQDPRNGFREEVEVSVGWIDKRPYALMAGELNKGEIADGAIFSAHRFVHPGGSAIREARCLLLQAKAVKDKGQLQNPTVCLNPAVPNSNSSTGRELRLLSTWPVFDLYPHSASGSPLVSGIDLQLPPNAVHPHGWFIGTPGLSPTGAQLQTWTHPWLCGPAVHGAPCTESLGSLLARFFSGGQLPNVAGNPVDAGAEFSYQYSDFLNPSSLAGYSRLCVEILRAIDGEYISDSWTNISGVKKKQAATLFSNPFHLALMSVYSAIRDSLQRLFYKKMPVLLVMRTSEEFRVDSPSRRRPGPPPIFLS